MFERFWNAVFWHDKFDQAWRVNSIFLKVPGIGYRWERRIEEKRAYWREHGRKRQLTPSQAVFKAFEDIADTIFAEHPNRAAMEETWIELAEVQYHAASTADWDSPYVSPESRLAARWQPYYAAYRAKREAELQDKERRARELQSHRFDRADIDEAWRKLLAGDVGRDVQAIWRHAEAPFKPAHEIASRANVSVHDFVFWMVVLRDHGLMNEHVRDGENLYCNEWLRLKGSEHLDQARKALLDHLAGRPTNGQ